MRTEFTDAFIGAGAIAVAALIGQATPQVLDEPVPTQEQVVFTHHCHEDEYQFVTPEGLACEPIDGGTRWIVSTEYEFARP